MRPLEAAGGFFQINHEIHKTNFGKIREQWVTSQMALAKLSFTLNLFFFNL